MKKVFLSGCWVRLNLGEGIACMVWVVSDKSESIAKQRKRALSILKRRLTQRALDECPDGHDWHKETNGEVTKIVCVNCGARQ